MAQFKSLLPDDVMGDLDKLYNNTEEIMGEMTKAGADAVAKTVKQRVPISELASHVKVSKSYKTPTDGTINTKVYFSGYLPFSGNRTTFKRRNGGKSGKVYTTNKGVPAEFLANVFEYGRSNGNPFPKKPFFRSSFNQEAIEKAMFEAQKKASGGILDDE